MAAHQLTLSVPGTPAAVTTARHQAVDGIRGWKTELDDSVVRTAALVISELVTNAIQHTRAGEVLLSARLSDAVLRIEVRDSNPVLPQPGIPDEYSENGRGLVLVAALTDRHGAEPTPTGKQCWAEIALASPSGAAHSEPPAAITVGDSFGKTGRPPQSYRCECWTEDLTEGAEPKLRASFDARSAPQADRWVTATLRAISPALDPGASQDVWDWLHDSRIETRRALLRTEPCTASVTRANTRITWTIRPSLPCAPRHSEDEGLR
ncbi:ATP-binding protein [Streptomyces lasiicapitis]|uniref:Histidine kinase/HSP90-like ATPase domain-containing protein n=1 Tax=Streptomyces lasiicapitis TaxID=1923961 RepID=A0ABQ2LYL3_9ACTN|nr:ATP-binding protein [Streptomyces lasiicapitis]GGO44655.1 hypothetical protein GCM10012286_31420 [Streptomyces lasiicapitis]